MENTNFCNWLKKESNGDIIKFTQIIMDEITQKHNQEALDFISETGDKKFTPDTFIKANQLLNSI